MEKRDLIQGSIVLIIGLALYFFLNRGDGNLPQNSSPPTISANQNSQDDVVSKLKEMIDPLASKMMKKIGQKKPIEFSENQERLVWREYSGQTQFDIKKSDSIVSPYVGYIKYEIFLCSSDGKKTPCSVKVDLAYQEGHWVVKDANEFHPQLNHNKPSMDYFE